MLRHWRAIVFCCLAILLFLIEFDGPFLLVGLVAPMVEPEAARAALGLGSTAYPPGWHPDNRWSMAIHASLGLLVGGTAIALLWMPRRRPLLAQFFIASFLVFGAVFVWAALTNPVPNNAIPFILVSSLVIPAILVALWPGGPRSLVAFRDRLSLPLLGLSLIAALALGFRAVVLPSDETVLTACMVVLAGLMAASGRPGARMLGVLAGVALIYLGLAAMLLQRAPGSWGILGGGLAFIGGAAFVAAASLLPSPGSVGRSAPREVATSPDIRTT